jgi:mRNA interferase RelE/StbE
MASYTIEWKRSAVKELRDLPNEAIGRIVRVVGQLAENPYPANIRKLVGSDHIYRIRVGDYRIIYSIFASALIVEIIRVGHRRDVYDR